MTWLRKSLFLTVAILLIVGGGLYVYLRGSLPQVTGTILVAGADKPLRILRDRHGIPHIFAETIDHAYFGLGFAHAQDRLWQMEMNRRLAAGRLSELFGAATIDTDKFLRTLGIYRQSERSLVHYDGDTRKILDSYAAGVNAFLATRSAALPPEFAIFRLRPEPWRPADSIGWGKMMALDLSGNWRSELDRMRLSGILSAQQLQEFFPPYPGDAPVVLANLSDVYREAARSIDLARLAAMAPVPQPEGMGSNNWVLHGKRSITGRPLLANDPHLGLVTPAVWYFARLSAPGLEAIGATLPGVPAIVLGRNQSIAWGFTNTGPDSQDLYLERVDPADGGKYLTPDGTQAFTVRRELIKVRGASAVEFAVRGTRHGPVISDVSPATAAGIAPGHVLALSWTALAEDDLTTQALPRLARAADWPQFLSSLRDFHSPQQNIVFADVDGNIGFVAPGRVPIRKPDNDTKGLLPAPGWDARYDWLGFIPFDELPRAFNPPSGVVVTANHKIVPDSYKHFITSEWTDPYRARRIEEMLAKTALHSLESFQALQADVASVMVRDVLPLLLAAPQTTSDARAAAEMLRQWNGATVADKPEPLIFAAWYRELTRLVFADELGEQFAPNWRMRPLFMTNVLVNRDGQGRWCDDTASAARETCPDMIARALEKALLDLKSRYGGDMSGWRWGEAHVAISEHRPFSRRQLFRWLFEIRRPSPGDTFSVNVGRYDLRNEVEPFANTHAASLRAIYDLADLDRSLFIHSTGQSGNLLSPHYNDFAARWARVEYLPMSMRRADIEVGALGLLTLLPQ